MLLIAAGLSLAGCTPQTPQEKQAEQIEDAADASADAVEAAAANQAAVMDAEAANLTNQAGPDGSYDGQRLNVRADALKKEAALVKEQAEAKARALRDAGRAQASALKAQ